MKYFLGLLIFLTSFSCYSQEKSIEYVFSKEVKSKIEIYIKNEMVKHPENIYYCVLSSINDNYKIDIQYYSAGDQSYFVKTVKQSNRYVSIDSLKVPIVFELDLKFVSYGTDAKCRHLRSYLIFENPHKILFDNSGKVLSSDL